MKYGKVLNSWFKKVVTKDREKPFSQKGLFSKGGGNQSDRNRQAPKKT